MRLRPSQSPTNTVPTRQLPSRTEHYLKWSLLFSKITITIKIASDMDVCHYAIDNIIGGSGAGSLGHPHNAAFICCPKNEIVSRRALLGGAVAASELAKVTAECYNRLHAWPAGQLHTFWHMSIKAQRRRARIECLDMFVENLRHPDWFITLLVYSLVLMTIYRSAGFSSL